MENSFQTSFIPKKPITSSISVSNKEPINFFSLITILLLVISILISIGLFAYKAYLVNKEEDLSSSLLITRDSFEKDTIDQLELFDNRTISAEKILANHVAASSIFPVLESITIPQVQYTNFDLQIDDKKVILVTLKGIAQDYRSIVLQSNVFSGPMGVNLKNVLFSNLTKDNNNNVNFNLKFNVDQDTISYEKSILSKKVNNPVVPVTTVENNTSEAVSSLQDDTKDIDMITSNNSPSPQGLNNKPQ